MADLSWWLDQIGRIPLLTPAQEIELGTAVQAWLQHPDGPQACPPGIRRRGQRARERFVQANLRLAVHYISRDCHRLAKHHAADDLIQAANMGLITAVERFDPTRGYRFTTYAYWWIRQAVNSWADRHSRTIAIPGSHSQHLGRLGPIRRRLQRELGRDPTRAELAAELGVSDRVFDQLIVNAQPIASLDRVIDDEGGLQLGDIIATNDLSLEEQEAQQERWRQAEQLRHMIRQLPQRDRETLTLAWGLDGVELSRPALAQQVGMSVRALDRYLEQIQQQLRGMAVQLVLIAVPPVKVTPRPRCTRRRRVRVPSDQLSLGLGVPWPCAGARAMAPAA